MLLNGTFFYRIAMGGIYVDWVGKARWWPEDESGDGFWDTEVEDLRLQMVGYHVVTPITLTANDIDSRLWDVIVDQAERECRAALDDKRRELAAPVQLAWPREVEF